jgi:hypothetical protein
MYASAAETFFTDGSRSAMQDSAHHAGIAPCSPLSNPPSSHAPLMDISLSGPAVKPQSETASTSSLLHPPPSWIGVPPVRPSVARSKASTTSSHTSYLLLEPKHHNVIPSSWPPVMDLFAGRQDPPDESSTGRGRAAYSISVGPPVQAQGPAPLPGAFHCCLTTTCPANHNMSGEPHAWSSPRNVSSLPLSSSPPPQALMERTWFSP